MALTTVHPNRPITYCVMREGVVVGSKTWPDTGQFPAERAKGYFEDELAIPGTSLWLQLAHPSTWST